MQIDPKAEWLQQPLGQSLWGALSISWSLPPAGRFQSPNGEQGAGVGGGGCGWYQAKAPPPSPPTHRGKPLVGAGLVSGQEQPTPWSLPPAVRLWPPNGKQGARVGWWGGQGWLRAVREDRDCPYTRILCAGPLVKMWNHVENKTKDFS